MTSVRLSPSECTAEFDVVDEKEYPYVIGNRIYVGAKHPEHGEVASLNAIQIRRNRCRGTFLSVLDEESDELHQFSQKLFNKFGHLKPELVDHEYHRGTGCWGREMDNGVLLYVESVDVRKPFQRQGVGSWLLQQLLQSNHVEQHDFVVAWPTTIDGAVNKREFKVKQDIAVGLFRKNGFRRIGRTSFFAYSPDPDHPSRSMPASEDVDSNARFARDDTDEEEELLPAQRAARHIERYPLHNAIVESLAQLSMQSLQMNPSSLTPIEDTIKRMYDADPTSIHKADDNGMTPLHIAAGMNHIRAVRAILSLPDSATILSRRDNTDGVTPVEACEYGLRSSREFSDAMLGSWDGYNADGLRVIYSLRIAAGQDPGAATEEEFIRKKQYGCTCGHCFNGWLSERMRFRLQWHADLGYDMMADTRPHFDRGQPLDPGEFTLGGVGIDFIPPNLRPSVYKTYYEEYRSLMHAISTVLSDQGAFPTPGRILQAARNGASFYTGKGGRVEHAWDYVTHAAKEQSPWGDSEWDISIAEFGEEGQDHGYKNLRQCENDLEFDLVREKLGLSSGQRWGPYEDDAFGEGPDMDGFDMDEFDDDTPFGAAPAGGMPSQAQVQAAFAQLLGLRF